MLLSEKENYYYKIVLIKLAFLSWNVNKNCISDYCYFVNTKACNVLALCL